MAKASPIPVEMLCLNFEDHTPSPEGYIQWHEWAETMTRTHRQRKCAGCNRYVIWEPKRPRPTRDRD